MAEDVQGGGGDELQFSAVETATPGQVAAAPACVACKRPIADQYYAAGDKVVCPTCRDQYEAVLASGSKLARLGKATGLGLLAGIVGAAVWFGITYGTGYIFAIVAIGVGIIVGGAVRFGAEQRGGVGYQLLAVALTYLALGLGLLATETAKYMKDHPSRSIAAQGESRNIGTGRQGADTQSTPAQSDATGSGGLEDDEEDVSPNPFTAKKLPVSVLAGILLLGALFEPIKVSLHSIIGAVIVGIALWEAWKINAGRRLSLVGPYSLAGGGVGIPQPLPPIAPGAQG